MLNATSQLLLEFVPGEVTVVRICEKAGVHTDYVVRYFGSREELLSQAIEAAFLGVFLRTTGDDSSRLAVVLEGKVDVMELAQARVRTIAYLLGCGVSPERFQSSQKLVLESVFAQSNNPNVGDRTRMNLILAGTLIIQAMGAFDEVNDMTEQQKQDMLGYIGYMSQTGETIQAALGWDKPAPKKKAKK
jgi:AcrR family transcriptional regulator